MYFHLQKESLKNYIYIYIYISENKIISVEAAKVLRGGSRTWDQRIWDI